MQYILFTHVCYVIAGEMAVIECGASVAGLAYWPCDLEGHWQTSMPDFSQCQSYWLQKLRGQLDKTADRQASIGTQPFIYYVIIRVPSLHITVVIIQKENRKNLNIEVESLFY